MTKTEEVVADILEFLRDHLSGDAMMDLKDRLQADHGISHEIVSSDAYRGPERARQAAGANDSHYRVGNRSAVFEMQAINRARSECAGYIPSDVLAFDSAADVYSTALKRMGMDTRGTPPANLPGIFRTMQGLQARATGGSLAMDSAVSRSVEAGFRKRFPTAVIPRRA